MRKQVSAESSSALLDVLSWRPSHKTQLLALDSPSTFTPSTRSPGRNGPSASQPPHATWRAGRLNSAGGIVVRHLGITVRRRAGSTSWAVPAVGGAGRGRTRGLSMTRSLSGLSPTSERIFPCAQRQHLPYARAVVFLDDLPGLTLLTITLLSDYCIEVP